MTCPQTYEAHRKSRLIQYWLHQKHGFHKQNFSTAKGSGALPAQSDQMQKLFHALQYTPSNADRKGTLPENSDTL